jgi:hypothetical protein
VVLAGEVLEELRAYFISSHDSSPVSQRAQPAGRAMILAVASLGIATADGSEYRKGLERLSKAKGPRSQRPFRQLVIAASAMSGEGPARFSER